MPWTPRLPGSRNAPKIMALGMDYEAGMDLNSELNFHASQEQMTCSEHTKAEPTERVFRWNQSHPVPQNGSL